MISFRLYIVLLLSINSIFSFSQSKKIDSLKAILYAEKQQVARLKLFNKIADELFDVDNDSGFYYADRAIVHAKKLLEHYTKSTDEFKSASTELGYTFHLLACEFVERGDYTKALGNFNESLRIKKNIEDKYGILSSFNSMGNMYLDQGNISKALYYYNRSLKIAEELNDKSRISPVLNNLGLVYKNQGDIVKGLDYYHKSLKIDEELGNKEGVAGSLMNIGAIYDDQNNYNKALDNYSMALKIYEDLADKEGIASAMINLGIVYNSKNELSTAMECFQKSLKIIEEGSNEYLKAVDLINIGQIQQKQKKFENALSNLKRAISIAKKMGFAELIMNSSDNLYAIYTAIGKYDLALEHYELYIKMRDSLNNIETQKATIKQQTQYEFDKQQALEKEKHAAELLIQKGKSDIDKKKQNIIIFSVSLVLLLVGIFSFLLYSRFKTTQRQKLIIETKEKETQQQKALIEEKQKEIVDSINYAKRIQYTLLAHDQFLKEELNEHFIFFNPKDIVSGDFYWATSTGSVANPDSLNNKKFYLAVCDSTGHGVPGAFMSLLNIGFLNEAINEKGIEKPNDIFDYVRQKLTDTISREGQKDGFDGILFCFDKSTNSITYAAANNAPVLIQNNQIIELPKDRMPVGVGERKENFNLYTIEAKSGDMIYLYTDGFADQFGGPKGKKFKYKQLNELLFAHHTYTVNEQHTGLKNSFNSWKGELEQVDDVCLIGIKI